MIDIRPFQAADVPRCGEIMYLAFKTIAEQHNFPPDFPNADVTGGLLGMLYDAPDFDGFVAEEKGAIYGSIFVSRRSTVGGISVITVNPESQDRTLGRQLMKVGMDCLAEQGHTRQQLIQAGLKQGPVSDFARCRNFATSFHLAFRNYSRCSHHKLPLGRGEAVHSCCFQAHPYCRRGNHCGAVVLGALGGQGIIRITCSLGLFWLVGVGGWLFYLLAMGVQDSGKDG